MNGTAMEEMGSTLKPGSQLWICYRLDAPGLPVKPVIVVDNGEVRQSKIYGTLQLNVESIIIGNGIYCSIPGVPSAQVELNPKDKYWTSESDAWLFIAKQEIPIPFKHEGIMYDKLFDELLGESSGLNKIIETMADLVNAAKEKK
jgi:hypothetical protein